MSLRSLPKKQLTQPSHKPTPISLSEERLAGLGEAIKKKFNWKHTPRLFQVEAITGLLQQRDVLVHAGTGFGKTVIAAGAHALEEVAGKVTFLVSPLIALQEEQAVTFEAEFGLRAIAINSAHNGLTKENLSGIRAGKWDIVIISPEMLLSKIFIAQVIRHRDMATRILVIVFDEAHVVSLWGSGFRKHYGTLGILKALLPRGTPFVAMSATLAPRVRNDVIRRLQLNQSNMVDINLGNDRKNVSIVVRAMHHPMNTYRDLSFIIPPQIERAEDVKKTFVYADSLAVATEMEDFLYELCPKTLQYKGFIRPYSAAFSVEYRQNVMDHFRRGTVRVLICTDAAGMGCNIPDIDIVVQWKLPSSISSFVQRAGRAARGADRTGLAVLLVEKSVYEADVIKYVETSGEREGSGTGGKSKKGGIRESSSYPKATKEYAKARGVLRGSHEKGNDKTNEATDVPLDQTAIDEAVFKNTSPEPTVPCCDICAPGLLDLTRPGPLVTDKRQTAPKRGIPNVAAMKRLHAWRVEVARRDFQKASFTGSGILSDDLVELLSSVGPIESLELLKKLTEGRWLWLTKYGADVLTVLQAEVIPPKVPKPRAPAKRGNDSEADDGREGKRVRVSTTITASTSRSVNHPVTAGQMTTSAAPPPPATPIRPTQLVAPIRPMQNPYSHLIATPPVPSPRPYFFPPYYSYPMPIHHQNMPAYPPASIYMPSYFTPPPPTPPTPYAGPSEPGHQSRPPPPPPSGQFN